MAATDTGGSSGALDGLTKLVQAGSTSPLALSALVLVLLAFLALYFFRKDSTKVRLTAFFSLLVVAIILGVAFLLKDFTQGPDVPEPKTATVYRDAAGTLFIEAEYDPPQLRRGETLSLEASTRQTFDDVPRLLLPSEIESVSTPRTHGRLSYDPGNVPIWYRFLVTDAQGKRWYGKAAIAKPR